MKILEFSQFQDILVHVHTVKGKIQYLQKNNFEI